MVYKKSSCPHGIAPSFFTRERKNDLKGNRIEMYQARIILCKLKSLNFEMGCKELKSIIQKNKILCNELKKESSFIENQMIHCVIEVYRKNIWHKIKEEKDIMEYLCVEEQHLCVYTFYTYLVDAKRKYQKASKKDYKVLKMMSQMIIFLECDSRCLKYIEWNENQRELSRIISSFRNFG